MLTVCFLMLVMTAPAYAQAPATSAPVAQALSPEDMIKIRDQLKTLSQAMGNPVATATAETKKDEKEDPNHKTVGDVADKALGLFTNAIGTLSESLKKIAPEVWRIMIRQQYASAAADLITPFGLLSLALIFYFSFRKKLTALYEKGREINQTSRYNSDLDSISTRALYDTRNRRRSSDVVEGSSFHRGGSIGTCPR